MAWKISSRNICIIIMPPLIMNGPIFRKMNAGDFRPAVYLILALARLNVRGGGVH